MRVLQIIDSLEAGGAERMAVNFANALADSIAFSGIVVTRQEGILKEEIASKVPYFFLNKTTTFDAKAIRALKKIIDDYKIDVLHVHGTSFFTGFLVKLIGSNVKILFHEHYGGRSDQSFLKNIPLFVSTFWFHKILVVNKQIEHWFHKFGIKKAFFFPNFASLTADVFDKTILKGASGKRIVCLANLKNPKNHAVLIKAFSKVSQQNKDWSLHLVGKNYFDSYSENIATLIKQYSLSDRVFLYDAKKDIQNILSQGTVGVLCSTYEGFPVTLLEYGLCKLAVVSSHVGFCAELIKHGQTGLLFNPEDFNDLAEQLEIVLNDQGVRNDVSAQLNTLVVSEYSKEKVIKNLTDIYSKMR